MLMRLSRLVTTAWTVCVVCLRKYFLPALQRTRVHPADLGAQVGAQRRADCRGPTIMSPRLTSMSCSSTRVMDCGQNASWQRAVVSPDFLHGADQAAGQHHDFLADAHDAAGDLAAEAAEIVQLRIGRIVRAVDPLDGQAEAVQVPVAGDVDGFQMAQQRRAGIPRRVLGDGSTTLSPLSALSGMNFTSLHVEPRQELLELVADFEEALLAPVHQVHLVHGDDQVRNAAAARRCKCAGGFAR